MRVLSVCRHFIALLLLCTLYGCGVLSIKSSCPCSAELPQNYLLKVSAQYLDYRDVPEEDKNGLANTVHQSFVQVNRFLGNSRLSRSEELQSFFDTKFPTSTNHPQRLLVKFIYSVEKVEESAWRKIGFILSFGFIPEVRHLDVRYKILVTDQSERELLKQDIADSIEIRMRKMWGEQDWSQTENEIWQKQQDIAYQVLLQSIGSTMREISLSKMN